ncbi:MAG: hypothetical protein A2626_02995 [Candidatus Nealsonbacteria bacterium RIFCSPHIGHO2_01_FULL_38_55]|uniref:POTRA domain-containing protein n=2 Tax=Candidatus Nealsoniibacteriota TaxID=1817911 RepID=A0A1G2EIV1_9BACT|nr:MAG: hypothetical protein US88_C0002G0070 [Parcubacteria group bacterium GW2011_GWA2_38_27]KKQ98716.1 MAG: hypothetical protein UT22_C0001G0034 [Parcubacteria group bacterium GW2011_GWC2_39_11]OGZ19673.1 MAG: hypothetical protein A2626_02995 [Candidatus Nealsonbacteria bacterium RIFCSPHIGHO2_01_FULL_38_55]OGZ20742.1 MAG: hypothetical protein A2W55_00055 [Candidatus Nealsonbacteria bacterium RIFCSPHIGHO2_02_38_10]OGZ20964.1 MAG: hypothetical protein A3C48_00490 [Candidatus Nealsonbacteria bac
MRKRYKKQYKVRRKGGIFRSKFFWFCFLALIFFGTGVDVFFFSSIFQVGNIKIEGNQKVSLEEIENIISKNTDKKFVFMETKSIFLTELSEMSEEILREIPKIAKINLTRDFPNTIFAQVVERIPIAIFCDLKKCFFIDNGGVAFEEAREVASDMLKIIKADFSGEMKLGEAPIKKEQIADIFEIFSKLKNLKLSAGEFLIKSDARFNIKISEGWEIFLNPQKDIDKQLKNLGIILKEKLPIERRKNLQYIDLRFDRIYIYPEGL